MVMLHVPRLWDVRGLAAGAMTKCFLPGLDGIAAVPRGQVRLAPPAHGAATSPSLHWINVPMSLVLLFKGVHSV